MAAAKSSRVNRKYKTKYKVQNWREYERGLRSRGDVTIWLSEEAIAAWTPPKNGRRGGHDVVPSIFMMDRDPEPMPAWKPQLINAPTPFRTQKSEARLALEGYIFTVCYPEISTTSACSLARIADSLRPHLSIAFFFSAS